MGLDLSAVVDAVPDWMVDAAKDLIVQAEDALLGRGRGKEKREFVRAELKKLARKQDLPWLPEPFESLAEDAMIDIVVTVVFKAIRDRLKAPTATSEG